jgi:hypothetical protein
MEVSIMVAVKEFSWEDISSPDFGARAAWREAVAAIAEKAKAKLPECNGRVDKAVALVLNGDVALLPDGTAKVASQSNGTTAYHVVNGHCDCRDYEKAPHNLCKHRLSAAIARRAQELAKAKLDAPATSQAEPPSQPPGGQARLAPRWEQGGKVFILKDRPQGIPECRIWMPFGKGRMGHTSSFFRHRLDDVRMERHEKRPSAE